jgi:serine/threonine protein kinase
MAVFQPGLPSSREQIGQDSERWLSPATEISLRRPSGAPSGGNPHASSSSGAHALKLPTKLARRFGRYRILKRLGRGAMGSVYLAHDTQLDRRVALKIPHFRGEGGADEPNRHDVDRFYREARIAATFAHPNLCPVFDVGQIDGIQYLSMAYIKGRSLTDYVDPRKPMPPQRVAAVVRKLAQALQVAHDRGVVHRDLKPSNIMVNSQRELVIMDFGLAWRVGSRDERLTKTGMVLGTPAYMSPEQLSGNAEALGPRCDIYSLGVIMYELLTACRPFVGQEAVILGQILFIEAVPPSGHRPDLDAQIEAICLKAMAKRPEDRYSSMSELAAALGDYLRDSRGLRSSPPAAMPASDGESEQGKSGEVGLGEEARSGAIAGEPLEAIEPAEVLEIDPDTVPATLERLWTDWTAIVELFALRRSRRHVDWQAYHELHSGLIVACRAQAAEAEVAKRPFYRHLEDLALPWLTPKTLAQVDQEILFSLLLCCRRAEQELDVRTGAREPPVFDARSSILSALVWGTSAFLALSIVAWIVSLTWSMS